MKKRSFILLLIALSIFSCDQKEKYEGKWTNDFLLNLNLDESPPPFFKIENDSIKFNYGTFSHWHNYKLEIKGNKFLFDNNEIDTSFNADTLMLNNNSYYVKDDNDSLQKSYYDLPILNLDLPKIDSFSKLHVDDETYLSYLFFGKRIDNNAYNLQLNDKYADVSDLRWFLNPGHYPYPTVYLFIDKSTPLKFLDQLFDGLINSYSMRIGLINDINLELNKSKHFYYEIEVLIKRLPSFPFDSKYRAELNKSNLTPGPPPPPITEYLDIDQSKTDYMFLIKNEMFHNKARINQVELREIIEKSITNNHTIFTLYDLESNYSSFLEMIAIIDNVYKEKREQKAKLRYNKSFKDLTKDERREVYLQIPMKHLWSYSIPHYQSILKNRNPIFGDDLKPLDSMLPNKWLDASVNR